MQHKIMVSFTRCDLRTIWNIRLVWTAAEKQVKAKKTMASFKGVLSLFRMIKGNAHSRALQWAQPLRM